MCVCLFKFNGCKFPRIRCFSLISGSVLGPVLILFSYRLTIRATTFSRDEHQYQLDVYTYCEYRIRPIHSCGYTVSAGYLIVLMYLYSSVCEYGHRCNQKFQIKIEVIDSRCIFVIFSNDLILKVLFCLI